MKLFKCQNCSQLLHFDNRQCLNCGYRLGYIPATRSLLAVEPANEDGHWRVLGQDAVYRFCANAQFDACNWLVAEDDPAERCLACRHNRTIPDLTQSDNLDHWRKVERAKHHLFYTLIQCRLPLETREEAPQTGLAFDFLVEDDGPAGHQNVMTGHDSGIITLNLVEADDAVREQRRVMLGEPYRTLLGHLRHETGHYFWDRLLSGSDRLQDFRQRFGDETADYGEALRSYYAAGPTPQWQETFVSAYAASHPWEDFAETWAHYLHIIDTLEMANAYGLHLEPKDGGTALGPAVDETDLDVERGGTIEQLIDAWLPVTLAVNSLNRCMGQPDFYPFVLTPIVIGKLGFIHDLVRSPISMDSPSKLAIAR
jgi:hypothetical protein